MCDKPQLGLATTRELLAEVECRMRIGSTSTSPVAGIVRLWVDSALRTLNQKELNYRTVDD